MRIVNRKHRLQDIIYFTALTTLMVILVAFYQAPPLGTPDQVQVQVSGLGPNPGASPCLPMAFRIPLDTRGELLLLYNISYAHQEVTMELRVAKLQHGLVLGLSDHKEVTNADLVLLWDARNQSYFGDGWSDGSGRISLDDQQDYELLEARQSAEGFTLIFRRLFITCDPSDYIIQSGAIVGSGPSLNPKWVLRSSLGPQWALRSSPGSIKDAALTQSGREPSTSSMASWISQSRRPVLMLRPDTPPPLLPLDVQMLEVVAQNMVILAQETMHWCSIHQLPEYLPNNHIIMYESVITPGNKAIIHHIEVFECSLDIRDISSYSDSCDNKMKSQKFNFCLHMLVAWPMGAETFYYPPDAGLPMGGPGSSRFLRLEVHYHSPLLMSVMIFTFLYIFLLHSGRRDSSGIRLHYTPSLRRYDAGIMELGLAYTPVMAISPRQETFYLSGFCSSKCTQTVHMQELITAVLLPSTETMA
ncbi:LOW QUALITY PROTEIN: dopamine beta-hydroxylase [Pholidichthys leucotaenia]